MTQGSLGMRQAHDAARDDRDVPGEHVAKPRHTPDMGEDEMIRPVVIWGAGAIGGTIGAHLVRAGHAVRFVDIVPEHVAAMRETGLRITGPVTEFRVDADATLVGGHGAIDARPTGPMQAGATLVEGQGAIDARPTGTMQAGVFDRPLTTVFLCVKAHHTADAVRTLAPYLAADGVVVSVQNGLNERVIAEVVGQARTFGCFVNFGADYIEPGVIHYGGRGTVAVGEIDGSITPRARAIHALFRDFDERAILSDNVFGYLWSKLAYASMLFATALTNDGIADALDRPAHRPVHAALAREVVSVAHADGIRLEPFDGFDPAAYVPQRTCVSPGQGRAGRSIAEQVDEASTVTGDVLLSDPAVHHPGSSDTGAITHVMTEAETECMDALVAHNRQSAKTHSGIWRDLAVRNRRTEVDSQLGPVIAAGAMHGIATPLNARLIEMIHEIERGERPQTAANIDELGKLGSTDGDRSNEHMRSRVGGSEPCGRRTEARPSESEARIGRSEAGSGRREPRDGDVA